MVKKLGSQELIYKDSNDHEGAVHIDKEPDVCPVCDRGIEPLWIDAYGFTREVQGHYVQSIYKCPRLDCQAVFISFYTSAQSHNRRTGSGYVFLRNTQVVPYIEIEKFSDEIEELSEMFVKIYTQAKTAEDMGLDEVCGAGYRKALEFLVKDYVIATDPESEKEVKELSLGLVIANKIDDEKIRTTAGLAKDKGNDEIHYIKKMEKLSLKDMKKLIRLTTNWIANELLYNNYASLKKDKAEPSQPTKE